MQENLNDFKYTYIFNARGITMQHHLPESPLLSASGIANKLLTILTIILRVQPCVAAKGVTTCYRWSLAADRGAGAECTSTITRRIQSRIIDLGQVAAADLSTAHYIRVFERAIVCI